MNKVVNFIHYTPKNKLPKKVIDKYGNKGRVQAKSNDGKDYLVFFNDSSSIRMKYPTVKAWWVKINQLNIDQ